MSDGAAWQHKLDEERGKTRALLEKYDRLLTEALSALDKYPHVTRERLEDVLDSIKSKI